MNLLIAYMPLCILIILSISNMNIRNEKERIYIIDNSTLMLTELNKSRGILAFVILINHILWINDFKMRLVSSIWGPLTFSTVFIFFFLSGFGMEKKIFINKKSMFKDAWRRIFYLIIVDIIVESAEYILNYVFKLTQANYAFFLIRKTNWYIYELIMLYIFFYVSRIVSNKRHLIINSVLTILLFVLFCYFTNDATWYISIFGFLFGNFFAIYGTQLINFINKNKIVFYVLTILCLVFHLFRNINYSVVYGMTENLLSCCFTVIFIGITIKFSIFNNKFCKKWKVYSMGIYIWQFVWLRFSSALNLSVYFSFVVVILLTCVSALLLNPISESLKRKINRLE